MKVCLINPPHEESLDSKLDPPLGLMYIASIIRNLGHEVKIIDLSFIDKRNWKSAIPFADLYGITCFTSSLHHAVYLNFIIKNCINSFAIVMVGGAHPSALPDETLLNLKQNKLLNSFNIAIIGEVEGILQDVFEYDIRKLPSIFNGNSKLMDINKIPFPARDLVPITQYTRTVNGEKATSIIASRGCPYKCSFCINSTNKSPVRFRSVNNIIKEMKEVIFKYNFKAFIFYDDTFTIHPQIKELLEEIEKLNVIFRCNGNVRTDTPELFSKLYNAGCREIAFGIESGNQKILDNIHKGTKVHQNKLAIHEAKKAGLIVKTFLMIGSPGESWDSIKDTINFMNDARPDQWTLFNFVPLPGCEIYNNPEKFKIKIINNDFREYFNIAGDNEGGLTVETEYMISDDIRRARKYMIEHLPKQKGKLQNYYNKLKEDKL